jgi:hypothetical protein
MVRIHPGKKQPTCLVPSTGSRAMQRTVLLVVLIGIIVIYDNRDSWSIPTEILPQQQQQSTISLSGSTPNTITTTQEDANEATSNLELAGDFQLAFREVFGFFDDITTAKWQKLKNITKSKVHHAFWLSKSPLRIPPFIK